MLPGSSFSRSRPAVFSLIAAAALVGWLFMINVPVHAAGADSKLAWPVAPAFVPGKDRSGAPVFVGAEDLEREIRLYSPRLNFFWAPHQQHVALDSSWLGRTLDWYRELLFTRGVSYQSEVWDCENFAQLLVVLSSLELAKYSRDDHLRLPIGWMIVSQDEEWALAGTGGTHAVVVARTEAGLEVIEPQNGQRTLLSSYPNRRRILEVYFE